MVDNLAGTCTIDSIESQRRDKDTKTMTIDQRNQACRVAAQAFRNAWALMDEALGYAASSEIGETENLANIIRILDQPEFLGISE